MCVVSCVNGNENDSKINVGGEREEEDDDDERGGRVCAYVSAFS